MAKEPFTPSCPVPTEGATIQLAHGGGGRLTRRLIEEVFLPAFANPALLARNDSAVVDHAGGRLALTTDAYVVSPLFFPGGDIGRLAVIGTVNDLVMAGARPRYLTAAFVLEEGFPIETLRRVVGSMREAAEACNVLIVTGDTKVVDRGKGDGVFITTAGVGFVPAGVELGPSQIRDGDVVLVSGDLGRHGTAILSVREGLCFESPIESDCAPLTAPVAALIEAGVTLHALRDLTRGGLAAALNEMAMDAGVGLLLDEAAIAVSEPVRGACELLGLDTLHVACEGRMVVILPEAEAARALALLRAHPVSSAAVKIGEVVAGPPGLVSLKTEFGGTRVVDLLSGEQLPRIC